jgi:endo-1,4-beta-mannosidase
MKFGVNYTPSNGWFHAWLHPDWDGVQRDLDAIAQLGMDHIRIFPLWPVLQPNRTWINQDGLADVRHMAQLASERDLDVFSDVLQGHLSSFDFVPSWLVSWHATSMFNDLDAIAAQAKLVKSVYEALEDIPRFKGLTIGNECNQFTDAVHPQRMGASPRDVSHWLDSLLEPVKERARSNGHLLLHAENDAVWYADGHAFEPRHASNIGDITPIHSWVFNGTAQHYGAMSEQGTRHAEYLLELAKAFSDDPERSVWLQEIGAPGNVVDERDVAEFCRASVEHALDCSNLYGVTWWCSHDVDHGMADFPPFEHDLGLFDELGTLKPIGREFKELAQRYRDRAEPHVRSTAIVIETNQEGNPTLRAACAPGGSIFEKWMRLSAEGVRPSLISSTIAQDEEELKARGITECISVSMEPGQAYSAVSDPSLEAAIAAA